MKHFICLLLFFPLFATSQVNIDSLKGIWNDASQPDTNRLKVAYYISWYGYLFSIPDSAIIYANKHLQLAKKLDNKEHIGRALNTIGAYHYVKGNYDLAIDYMNKSLKPKEEINDQKGIAASLSNIGALHKERGDFAKAIDFYTKALKIQEQLENQEAVAKTYSNISSLHYSQKDLEKASEYIQRSLEIYKKLENKRGMAECYNEMGLIYDTQNQFEKSKEFHNKALKLREEVKDTEGRAMSLNNLGILYKKNKQYDQAITYYEESFQVFKDLGNKKGMANSLKNIGALYLEKKQFKVAKEYGERSLEIAQEMGLKAIIRDAAGVLWKTNKQIRNFSLALDMFELHIASRDSIESDKNKKEIIRQEYKYQYEKQALKDSIKNAEAQKVKDAELAAEKAESKKLEIQNKQQQQQKYFLFGGLALSLIFGGFIFNRFQVTRKQKGIIEEQKEKVDEAYDELEEKNQEILDSINYAQRIQSAILPPQKLVKSYLNQSFILYKPKDIVAGDFYWLEHKGDQVLFAACDCTGHGVPGAMVSVVCNNGLNRSVREYGLTDPGRILDKTREIVIQEFEKSEEEVKDGMDIALVSLEQEGEDSVAPNSSSKLKYAGAHNPLWIIRKGATEVEEIKANKQPIGKFADPVPYTTHQIDLKKGDSIYIFSDGFADQFGGEKGKKFKAKNFKNLLLSVQNEPMEKQRELIDQTFEEWKGSLEQLDDVCVIGYRV